MTTLPPGTSEPVGQPATETPGCGSTNSLVPGTNERTLESGGLERSYILWVPESYSGSEPRPALFTFHGRGSNKEQQIVYSGFTVRAQEEDVLVVAPDAVGSPMQWSPYGRMTEADDAAFVDDLIEDLGQVACVDTTRLWATGMSSGGFMTSSLACARPDTFAAFGPVAMTAFNDGQCASTRPVPMIAFHGTDDGVVSIDGIAGKSIPSTLEQWAEHNGCDPEPEEERIGSEVIRRHWTGCEATTEFYVVEGGGHTWPGAIEIAALGYTTKDVSATDVLWELFLDSQLPA